MKYLAITMSFFLLYSCKAKKGGVTSLNIEAIKYTEQEKRILFIKNIARRNCNDGSCGGDTSASFQLFMQNYYPDLHAVNINDPIIYAVEEPYIDSARVDTNIQWIRITRDGTWSSPYCIIGERKNFRTYFTIKITDGLGGYFPGILKATQTITFADTVFNEVERTLSKFKFWSMRHNNNNYCVTDGVMWTLEAISRSKYNIVKFYSPNSCGNDTTKSFENLATWLGNKAEIGNIFAISR